MRFFFMLILIAAPLSSLAAPPAGPMATLKLKNGEVDYVTSVPPEGPAVPFAKANTVIRARCVPCHSANPTQPGVSTAPKGVRLDTRAEIEAQAAAIEQQAVVLKAMPLGNATHMTQAERDLLDRWLRSR